MYIARTATVADLDAVIALVARLQQEPAHQIGFHGETEDEIAAELAALTPDWVEGAVVAVDRSGRMRGVLSVRLVGTRAAICGPFVDVPANHPAAGNVWQATADAMLAHARQLPALASAHTMELTGHRDNRLLADFADRHGAPIHTTTRRFTLTAAPLRSLLVRGPAQDDRAMLLPSDEALTAAVVSLHDRCFPGMPADGRRLVSDDRFTVVVLVGDRGLLGYAAGRTTREEYHVSVVGVDEEARSCGVGRTLVRRLLSELSARDGVRDRATAMIRDVNDASEHMFTKLGFAPSAEWVNYQADLTTPRAHGQAVAG
jgi:ribosomal protein S18 acetylase RimI-like enzyme